MSDTGNHRVLRIVSDQSEVVIGDGSVSSAGEGAPARRFPVAAPRQLALDAHGNLFVASSTTVRQIANVDGDDDADGDDAVFTIFGLERAAYPESDAFCVSALAASTDGGGVFVADGCQGFMVELQATP